VMVSASNRLKSEEALRAGSKEELGLRARSKVE